MYAAAGTNNETLTMVFLAITASSMGFGLLCITSASLCLMFGREKALLGGGTTSEDSLQAMDTAIGHLKTKSHQCFFYFITQLVLFHLSSFLLMWVLYQNLVAIVVNVVLGLFLVFFFLNGSELFSSLYISDDQTTDTNMDNR